MNTPSSRLPASFISALAVASLLALAGGCMYVSTSSGNYSDGNLPSMTNRVASGTIPEGCTTLDVDNSFGPLRVTAADGATGSWAWKLTVQAKTDASAAEYANATQCAITRDGGTVRVAVSLPDNSGPRHIESELEIRVPKSMAVRAANRFGRMEIRGVTGDVQAANQNGSVELSDLPGKIEARTSFASLTAERVGPATLKDQNGRLEVSDVKGDLDAQTSFASLEARNVGGKALIRDQNGSVEADHIKGDADLHTSFASLRADDIAGKATVSDQNGSVELDHVTGDVDGRTSFASMRVDNVGGSATLANQNGRIDAQRVAGSVKANTSFSSVEIESGGRNIQCRDQNGSVHIRATSLDLTSLDAETSFSSMEIRLPAGLKPTLRAHTSFGDVDSDFPVIMKRGQDASSDLEAGGPQVQLRDQNGNIRVVREKSVAEK